MLRVFGLVGEVLDFTSTREKIKAASDGPRWLWLEHVATGGSCSQGILGIPWVSLKLLK